LLVPCVISPKSAELFARCNWTMTMTKRKRRDLYAISASDLKSCNDSRTAYVG
jgi:hypothetical protein